MPLTCTLTPGNRTSSTALITTDLETQVKRSLVPTADLRFHGIAVRTRFKERHQRGRQTGISIG